METQADRDAIADEAVGQRHESPPPEAQKKNDLSPEEDGQRLAKSAGAQASIPEKTAESLGERVADAYSDPNLTSRPGSIGRAPARGLSTPFELQPFLTLIAGFALGYCAALLLHDRIKEYLGGAPEPFQITHPPQGDRHPRGFVQSTVLKTITEHPQGMTAVEIVNQLGREGIGRPSIEQALGALVRANKITLQGRGANYLPAAGEVPTAPDQPSS
jgi:hypothetical protein